MATKCKKFMGIVSLIVIVSFILCAQSATLYGMGLLNFDKG
jgi:hypothetical protein